MNVIPQSVQNTLWSYDIPQIDLQKDKNLVIFNVLNCGTVSAIVWLYQTYTVEDIQQVIRESNVQNWSKKSLNYWSSFFDIQPIHIKRFS